MVAKLLYRTERQKEELLREFLTLGSSPNCNGLAKRHTTEIMFLPDSSEQKTESPPSLAPNLCEFRHNAF